MAINPNIALSFQGPKFEDPVNRLAQFEQLRQYRQNAMLKEQEMRLNQQKLESQNALKNLYASGQPVTLQQAMGAGGLEGAKFYADIKSAEEKELKAKSASIKAFDDALKSAKSVFSSTQDNRESYAQAYENVINKFPDLKPYIETPDTFKPGRGGTLQRLTISANDLLSNENKRNETAAAAVQNLINQANSLSSKIFKVTPEGVAVEDPYAKAQYQQIVGRLNQILQEGGFPISGMQDVTARAPSAATGLGSKTPIGSGVLEQPVDTATTPPPPSPAPEAGMPVARAGGSITEQIAGAEATIAAAKKQAESEEGLGAEQEAARRKALSILDQVGYDPETGKTVTEDQILKSVGSGIESKILVPLARLVNYTTGPMKESAKTMQTGKSLVVKYLGSLGAQISDADREFYESIIGRIGDESLTTEERAEAFRQFINGVALTAKQGYAREPFLQKPSSAPSSQKASSNSSQAAASKQAPGTAKFLGFQE